jgi:hypothetical protein
VYRDALALRPFSPDAIVMVMELAGQSDNFQAMLQTARKADELYSMFSNNVTNTTSASIYHKIGKVFLDVSFLVLIAITTVHKYPVVLVFKRGLNEEALGYLQKSIESSSSFVPALKSAIEACAQLGRQEDGDEFLALLKLL